MVIWLIGLSGSGKTTIGRKVYEILKKDAPNTVLVDGDEVRAIFKHDRGTEPYTVEGRNINAQRICNMCGWLDSQSINVVCCVLSIFEESRDWNRQNYSSYFEVFVDVPIDILRKRDIKNLYEPAFKGETKNVVGVDIPFPPPQNADYVFDNSESRTGFDDIANDIVKKAIVNCSLS